MFSFPEVLYLEIFSEYHYQLHHIKLHKIKRDAVDCVSFMFLNRLLVYTSPCIPPHFGTPEAVNNCIIVCLHHCFIECILSLSGKASGKEACCELSAEMPELLPEQTNQGNVCTAGFSPCLMTLLEE